MRSAEAFSSFACNSYLQANCSRETTQMKRLVIVLVTVFALSFFYFFTKERATGPELRAPIQERYNGGDFTITLPTGSTPVKVQNSTKSVGEQQMVQNAYSFSNSTFLQDSG